MPSPPARGFAGNARLAWQLDDGFEGAEDDRRQSNALQPTLDLLARGVLRPEQMVTHRFRLAQCQAAFDLVSTYSDGVMKAMIDVG